MTKKKKKAKIKKALSFIRSQTDDKNESFLKKIHIQNFKSFEKDTSIELSPKINSGCGCERRCYNYVFRYQLPKSKNIFF